MNYGTDLKLKSNGGMPKGNKAAPRAGHAVGKAQD